MRSNSNSTQMLIKKFNKLDDAIIDGMQYVDDRLQKARLLGYRGCLEYVIKILNAVSELEQAKCEIESELNFPVPVKRDRVREYDSPAQLRDCFMKIHEEYMEAYDEYMRGDIGKMAEELQDIIHVCVTTQELSGYGFEARQQLCKKVNKKNKARGYLDNNNLGNMEE